MNIYFDKLDKYTAVARDLGLLALRLGVGFFFFYVHGLPKLMAGPELWAKLGGAMGNLGINFAPVFWGFLAASAECLGGLFLMLGLLTRPAAAVLCFNMLVATVMHLSSGDGLKGASHAAESLFVFLALLLAGAGRYSADQGLFKGRF